MLGVVFLEINGMFLNIQKNIFSQQKVMQSFNYLVADKNMPFCKNSKSDMILIY